MTLTCLATGACTTEADLGCAGSGEEILRCRAERSGEPEAQELVEFLLDGRPPTNGR